MTICGGTSIVKGRRKAARSAPASVQCPKGGGPRVTVAPITYTPPTNDGEAVKLPPRVKHALGRDDDRSWIVLDEVNQFAWPGQDIRPVPGSKDRFAYGFIPPRLFDTVIRRIIELAAARRVAQISRSRVIRGSCDLSRLTALPPPPSLSRSARRSPPNWRCSSGVAQVASVRASPGLLVGRRKLPLREPRRPAGRRQGTVMAQGNAGRHRRHQCVRHTP